MSAILKLAEEVKDFTQESDKKFRSNRQHFIESELVEFRADFLEATEILASLKTGLALKVGPYGDDLPLEIEYAFNDLMKLLESA